MSGTPVHAHEPWNKPCDEMCPGYRVSLPERCPGYTCDVGREWSEAHRDVPIGDGEYPPGHFWYHEGGQSYMAHALGGEREG